MYCRSQLGQASSGFPFLDQARYSSYFLGVNGGVCDRPAVFLQAIDPQRFRKSGHLHFHCAGAY